MLNKLSVTQLAELSSLSKSYISQVKHGRRPPSRRLLESLGGFQKQSIVKKPDIITLFLQSRKVMGVSPGTVQFYVVKLGRFFREVGSHSATRQDIERFLLQFKNPGNRHAYFRAIRTFYNWREQNFDMPSPMKHMKAPRLPKLIMPSLEREQVRSLIARVDSSRDKAIIALFTESGLRLSELEGIRQPDINWNDHNIRVIGKGQKEALAPFSQLTTRYLREWLEEYEPNGGNVWGFNKWGIISMLRRLREETGLPCNPHTFRRTFACLLRKAGLDSLTIKDLGRWESIEMVQRYTRSVTFQDSMRLYSSVVW